MDSIPAGELNLAQWRRVCLGHGIKLGTSAGHIYKYDGFRDTVSGLFCFLFNVTSILFLGVKHCSDSQASIYVFSFVILQLSQNPLGLALVFSFFWFPAIPYFTLSGTVEYYRPTRGVGLLSTACLTKDLTQATDLPINNFHLLSDISQERSTTILPKKKRPQKYVNKAALLAKCA